MSSCNPWGGGRGTGREHVLLLGLGKPAGPGRLPYSQALVLPSQRQRGLQLCLSLPGAQVAQIFFFSLSNEDGAFRKMAGGEVRPFPSL